MTEPDTAHKFIDTLPRLGPEDRFRFRCDPTVACFNRCCSDLHLELSPYDLLRLRRALGMSGRHFLQEHAEVGRDADTGLPQVMLRMREDDNRTCPFLRESGCGLYADRPGACRSYPVGRGASLTGDGRLSEQFVLVREEHCLGLDDGPEWTARAWMKDQGMEQYNRFNDLHLHLLFKWRERGRPLDEGRFQAVLLALYDADDLERGLQLGHLLQVIGE
jgi:Fe-S-cluster containining protein